MQRVLIVSSVVLALVLGWLLWQRSGKPAEAPKPAVAAAPAPAPVEPAPAPKVEPVKPPEPAEPAKAAEPVAAAPPPVAAPPARPAVPKDPPRKPSAAAMNAIFGDRPADGEQAQRPAPAAPRPAPSSLAAAPAKPAPAPTPAPPPDEPAVRTDLTGGLAGTVRDARGTPIAGATVAAISADGLDAFETITGDDGFYLLSGMKAGRYVLFPGLGTPLGARICAHAAQVLHGTVRRHDLVEPVAGSTIRVHSLRADGLPVQAQAVLVRGRVATPASLPALLASEAIYLPEGGASDSVLRRVPAGVYTLVILQDEKAAPRVAREPLTVQGQGELRVDVRLPIDLAAAWNPAAG